jgi:hypothetical protein
MDITRISDWTVRAARLLRARDMAISRVILGPL